MLLRKRKTSKRQNVTHRRTRVESLESRLCLSGCDISGTVYDARFSVGEQPLAGVQVFLDDNTNGVWDSGEAWTISDGNGEYSFQGLQPGSYPAEYTVAQTVPEGYTLTTPALGYHTVTFNQEGSATDKDFGNTPNSAKVDIFALGDDTGSFENTISAALSLFKLNDPNDDCLIELLQAEYPLIDWAFGVGRFEDYDTHTDTTDRPFILNQPIVQDATPGFANAILGAITRENTEGDGGDEQESAVEALYQVATGAGFDGNNNSNTTDSGAAGSLTAQTNLNDSGDVPAFSTFLATPPSPILPPSGTLGGVGFRQDSTRIVIIGTDAGTKFEPESPAVQTIYGLNNVEIDYEDFTTGGSPGTPYQSGAKIQETVTALNNLGVYVIGIGNSMLETTAPRRMLEAFARATGAVNNGPTISVDGGYYSYDIEPGEPLYFLIDDDLSVFAGALFSAIETQMPAFPRDISGTVWNDLNDDGVFDAGESGKSGITVYLDYNQNGERDAGEYQTTTDANGFYSFQNVIPSEIHIRVDLPVRWGMTPPGTDYVAVDFRPCFSLENVDIGIQEITAVEDTYLDDPNGWFTTEEDTPLEIAVGSLTANDYATVPSTQNPVSFSAVDDSLSVGTVRIDGSTITYTPAEDWHGTDTFLYSLTDGYDYTDWAIVTVEVTPVNDAPRIVTEFRTRDGLELSGTLASDVEGDEMTALHFFGVEHGSFAMDDDGTFTYTPDPGFIGIETIWVNFVDSHGASSGDMEVVIAVCETVVGTAVGEEEVLTHEHLVYSVDGLTVTDSSGDLLIVGSPDSDRAFIYRQTLNGWGLEAELQGDAEGIKFGSAVAVRGTTAVVGAMLDWDDTETNQCGAVYLFEYEDGEWTEVNRLTPDMDDDETQDVDGDQIPDHQYAGDGFGSSVAINEDGDAIVIGAPGYEFWEMVYGYKHSRDSAGAAYVFTHGQNGWVFDQRLDPDDQEQGAEFGNSVAISSATIVIGAHRKDEANNADAGAVYVFSPGTGWEQTQKLTAQDGGANDYFGCSVGVYDPNPQQSNDEKVVIGARGWDEDALQPGTDMGAVYCLTLNGSSSQQGTATYRLGSSTYGYDAFGSSVDIQGDLILVGAPAQGVSQQYRAGAAYLIDTTVSYPNDDWRSEGLIVPAALVPAEEFGACVALGDRGAAITGPGFSHDSEDDQAALHFFSFNRTPAAQDMELVVAGASGTDYECGSVFGVDAFERDSVTYSIVAATTGYQEHGTFSFEDPSHPEVVTYTPTSVYPVSDKFQYKVTDADGAEDIAEVTVYFGSPQIVNRGVFYVDSGYADARDANKEGSSSASADGYNVVAHPDGITGVIIDIAFPSDPGAFSPADFVCFYVSGGNWVSVVPTGITVEVVTTLEIEEGVPPNDDYDCHRVRLTFAPLLDTWLEVTVDDAALGISADTFYFAHLEADASGDGQVGTADLDLVRAYWGLTYTAPGLGDINGDTEVNTEDLDLVRTNWGNSVVSAPSRSMSSSESSVPAWTAEADRVFEEYGIGDGDAENDLAIDEKFWEKLYEALGLKW